MVDENAGMKWISVKDALPDRKEFKVLVVKKWKIMTLKKFMDDDNYRSRQDDILDIDYDTNQKVIIAYYDHDWNGGTWVYFTGSPIENVTHWMKVPEMPKL